MIERKQHFFTVLLVYFFIVIFLFAEILFRQIRFLDPLIPDFYSIIFYINVIFCPLKITVINLFIIGIIEDSVLNHTVGLSSLVYFVFLYPVNKINNIFIHNSKQKILAIFLIFSVLALAKSLIVMLVSGGNLQLRFNIIGMISSTIIALIINHCK